MVNEPGSTALDPGAARSRTRRSKRNQAVSAGACLHCGLPTKSVAESFCCRGCETVYALIRSEGLEHYYALRPDRISPPARLASAEPMWLEELFEPNLAGPSTKGEEATPAGAPPMRLFRLDVQGVHCAACVWLLEELFSRHAGGRSLRVNPLLGKAEMLWQGSSADLTAYLRDVERFGYRFGPDRKPARAESSRLLLRLGICAAAAMNAMIFSISFYSGLSVADGRIYQVIGWANFALATLVVSVGGPVFFRPVIAGLSRRWAHLDLPIAMGILLSYLGSVYAHFKTGPEAAYFDTVAAFTTLMLFGRWLQEQLLERNRRSLLDRTGSEHLRVRRLSAGEVEIIPVLQVEPGDELLIPPGDLVPVDGILESEDARAALDWITGESEPISFVRGTEVPAGAFNVGGCAFRVTAAQRFVDSRVQSLLLAPPAAARSSAAERFWRKISIGYVSGVLTVAALALVLWWGQGIDRALSVTVAILVVTCPCAIGLAAPLARELAAGHLRRHGVFVLRGSFFERAVEVRKILFDKTGTLTSGSLALTETSRESLAALVPTDRWILQQMTSRSSHPVASAVHESLASMSRPAVVEAAPAMEVAGSSASKNWLGVAPLEGSGIGEKMLPGGNRRAANANGLAKNGNGLEANANGLDADTLHEGPLEMDALDAIEEMPGQGIVWRFRGSTYRFGRSAFAGNLQNDKHASCFARDGKTLAVLAMEEEIPSGTDQEIRALERAGYSIHLLSGDRRDRVSAAAARLGLDARQVQAELDPDGKARAVAALDRHDTLMVGDGLNDAPSFEAAHATATPAVDRSALSARADLYYVGEGIASIGLALRTARQLQRVVRANTRLALLYNVILVGLCLSGNVSPLLAAIVMPVSSTFFVALTAWRLRERNLGIGRLEHLVEDSSEHATAALAGTPVLAMEGKWTS